jgi:hypothetical protein
MIDSAKPAMMDTRIHNIPPDGIGDGDPGSLGAKYLELDGVGRAVTKLREGGSEEIDGLLSWSIEDEGCQ